MRSSLAIALLLITALTACGPTIGDACTTASECGGGTALCVNKDFSPGGYCTEPCKLTDDSSCPTGAICVKDALGKNAPACFRVCRGQADCRNGYTCRAVNNSPLICVGPVGF